MRGAYYCVWDTSVYVYTQPTIVKRTSIVPLNFIILFIRTRLWLNNVSELTRNWNMFMTTIKYKVYLYKQDFPD